MDKKRQGIATLSNKKHYYKTTSKIFKSAVTTKNVGFILGAMLVMNALIIPYSLSECLVISIVAELDFVFGGIASVVNGKFDLKIVITDFLENAILSILLIYLGERLNVDIYLVAIIVYVERMFNNLVMMRVNGQIKK